jgi:hypothetical protein
MQLACVRATIAMDAERDPTKTQVWLKCEPRQVARAATRSIRRAV